VTSCGGINPAVGQKPKEFPGITKEKNTSVSSKFGTGLSLRQIRDVSENSGFTVPNRDHWDSLGFQFFFTCQPHKKPWKAFADQSLIGGPVNQISASDAVRAGWLQLFWIKNHKGFRI